MENNQSISSLNGSVLVLNRFYVAVHVVSVRRAMILLYRDMAEVIHVEDGQYFNYDFMSWVEMSEFASAEGMTEGHDWIRSVQFPIQVPRVLRLFRYDKIPVHSLKFNRKNLFARDNNRCQYCGKVYSLSHLSFDHVIPRSRGGTTCWENVVCSCLDCNGRKRDRTPEEAGMRLVRKPAKPKQNPLLSVKLENPKYESWKSFLGKSNSVLEVS